MKRPAGSYGSRRPRCPTRSPRSRTQRRRRHDRDHAGGGRPPRVGAQELQAAGATQRALSRAPPPAALREAERGTAAQGRGGAPSGARGRAPCGGEGVGAPAAPQVAPMSRADGSDAATRGPTRRTLPLARRALVAAIARDTPGTDQPRLVKVLDALIAWSVARPTLLAFRDDARRGGVVAFVCAGTP